jgi:hypothetical protein
VLLLRALACLVVVGACTEPVLELPARNPSQAASSTGNAPSTGRARAFRIEHASDLLVGPEAGGAIGDLRIDNGRVAFIVDRVGAWNGFASSGGNLVDAAPAGGKDCLKQLFGSVDTGIERQPIYERVEPGRTGDAAMVEAIGHDSSEPRIRWHTRYTLQPGAIALEIATTITNQTGARLADYRVGDAIQWGRTERFTPGWGFDGPRGSFEAAAGWIGALGDGVTYFYVVEGEEPLAAQQGFAIWSDSAVAKLTLEPGASAKVVRWLVVGDAAGVEAAATVNRLRKQSPARLQGHVVEENTGRPLDGVTLVLSAAGKALAFTRSVAGSYALEAPPGDYRLRAEAPGRRGLELDVSLREGATTVDALLSRAASIAWSVSSGGAPSPAKLTVLDESGASARLGAPWGNPGGNVQLSATGRGTLALAPGRWRLFASRGPEFTVEEKRIEVPDGATAPVEVAFQLERAVDTGGWWCADLHQHAAPSPDSAVAMRDRAAANLAEGLDVLVATDHNNLGDWQLGLSGMQTARPLRVVLGDEATVDGVGHWNAYPLERSPDAVRGGALDVRGLDAHKIVGALAGADRVVQVNHPRVGIIGYFNDVKFDDDKPLPANWEGGFDAIEVFSSKDPAASEAPLRDWFSLLDRGGAYTAVGGSDSHLTAGQEIGYPRTCIAPGGDDPGRARVEAIKRKREAFITNGPFVRVAVGNRGMGQLAAAPKGRARLDVEVRAAPWVDVRRLEVFVNGMRHGKPIEVAASHAPVRYHDGIDLKLNQDAYVVVLVRGDQPLDPVVSRRPGMPPTTPLAITNPIFLDRDLDGKYTPPALWKKK